MNHFDAMKSAMQEARTIQRSADNVAGEMADMLSGRLRKVGSHRLKQLKKELRSFNANTGQWKD